MKLHINKEEKFIFILALVVLAFLFVRGQFLKHEEEAVETAYEAGYTNAMSDVVEMTTVVSTYEVDGNCYIVLELPDGNEHVFVSPAAKG